jgi:hypothetical protein
MMAGHSSGQLRLLIGLDARRLRSAAGAPTLPLLLGVGLPPLVLLSALWTLGRAGTPDAAGAAGGLTVGMLAAGAVSFLAYGILFRGADTGFLRLLGATGRAIFMERGTRLCLAATGIGVAFVVPFAAAGEPTSRPLAVALGSALTTAGLCALTYAFAARSAVGESAGALLSAGIRKWDPDLARAAPLVYAPLPPFVGGAAAGAWLGSMPGTPGAAASLAVALGAAAVVAGTYVFQPAAPRFLPRVGEMAYVPPPLGGGEVFRVGRGLTALLPRRAAAVWVRDATVAGRRFAWASRITWPVAILSAAALARWGEAASTRLWVLAAVGLALVVQAGAIVGLGLLERAGLRWIDRGGGLSWWERFLGRWAWAWGLSLWLLVPVALAWAWWTDAGGAGLWPVAGALSAALATGASLLNAERR